MFSNNIPKILDLYFDQSLEGKLYRFCQRIFYIFQHPRKMYFIICLMSSKLIPSYFKIKILSSKYQLDTLWLLKLLGKADSNLNYYAYLNYKIYYTLKNIEYEDFIVSLGEIQQIF